MIDIILALFALGVLVTVHEAGHFLAARLCGVRVEVFSIGFGKPIIKFRRSGIDYRIGWLPLGGYVRMKGEALDEDAPEEADSFQYAKWWKKLIIAVAGPFANFILAVLIFILSFMLPGRVEDLYPVVGRSNGIYSSILQPGDSILAVNNKAVRGWYHLIGKAAEQQISTVLVKRGDLRLRINLKRDSLADLAEKVLPQVPAVVGEVSPGMPAWRAGLRPGDRIVRIDSSDVKDWYVMRELISSTRRDTVRLTLNRSGKSFVQTLQLEENPLSEGQRLIGISQQMPVVYYQSNPPLKAMKYGISATTGFVAVNYVGLYKLITNPGTIKSSVGGPVMIYSLSSQSAKKGWNSWIVFVAAISLVLMIMNLLPIPALDGGHVMFALIQAVTGKPLPHKVQIILQNIGFMLLLLLMVYAFYNDFSKVLARAYSGMGKP